MHICHLSLCDIFIKANERGKGKIKNAYLYVIIMVLTNDNLTTQNKMMSDNQ